ncbi:hypothetical protein ACFQ3S_01960, partial [Mucilaginibacter terrae]|uniref:hypothetical protein n=1 Tax=Mucilaginibacter terrae TaxID=1955052 RepID=UPI00362558DE
VLRFMASLFVGDEYEEEGGITSNYPTNTWIGEGPYAGGQPGGNAPVNTQVGGGSPNNLPPYGGVELWVSRPVVVSGPGCGITPGNGDPAYIDSGEDGGGTGCDPDMGSWESTRVSDDIITANLIRELYIPDLNKQAFLFEHIDIVAELYDYLLTHGSTPENKEFLNWAVDYLYQNQTVDFNLFTKQFLNAPYGPVITTPVDNYVATDPESGQSFTYGQVRGIFENTAGLIDAVEADDDLPLSPTDPAYGLIKGIEFVNEYHALSIIHPEWNKAKQMSVALWNVLKGDLHFTLDLVGLLPVAGEAADLINGAIYFVEGNRINCALSVASALPVVGWVSTGGKWIKRAVTAVPLSSIPIGAQAFRAIKTAKGAVKFVKTAVSTFSHSALHTLKAVKPGDNTLTNLGMIVVNQLSHRIKPVAASLKNKVDDIVLHGDNLGNKTEDLADELFHSEGFAKHPSQFGSNNGFDGVYIKTDASGNVQEIIINEAKQVGTQGNIKLLPTAIKGPQMSERWINATIVEMQNNASNPAIQSLGNLIDANRAKVIKTITAVDRVNAEIVIIKLSDYL